jgi:hypothetical protein
VQSSGELRSDTGCQDVKWVHVTNWTASESRNVKANIVRSAGAETAIKKPVFYKTQLLHTESRF